MRSAIHDEATIETRRWYFPDGDLRNAKETRNLTRPTEGAGWFDRAIWIEAERRMKRALLW